MRGAKIIVAAMLGCMASTAVAAETAAEQPPGGAPTSVSPQPVIPPTGEYRAKGYGSIPLENYLVVAPFKNGCAMIVQFDNGFWNTAAVKQSSWHGACRFGLIHGKGYVDYKNSYYSGLQFIDALNGRIDLWPFEQSDMLAASVVRGPRRDRAVTINISKLESDPFRKTANSMSISGNQSAMLAMETVTDDKTKITDVYYLVRESCPAFRKIDQKTIQLSFFQGIIPAETMSALLKFCRAAASRLQAEGRMPGEYEIRSDSPYDDVDYGHYYYVSRRHNVNVRSGLNFVQDDSQTKTDSIRFCPQVAFLAGCESLWTPTLANLEQKAGIIRENAEAIAIADQAEWNARFAPWEKIARAKIAAFLAKGGGQ
jgi:hypothetical protein